MAKPKSNVVSMSSQLPKNEANKELVKRPSNTAMIRAAVTSVEAAFKAIGYVLANNPSDGLAAECYAIINERWMKPIDELRKATRDFLVDKVRSTTPNLQLEVSRGVERFRIKVVSPKSSKPDAGKVLNLCEEKGIAPEQLCDQVIDHVPSMDKIEKALADGLVTEEEIGECYKSLGDRLTVEKL